MNPEHTPDQEILARVEETLDAAAENPLANSSLPERTQYGAMVSHYTNVVATLSEADLIVGLQHPTQIIRMQCASGLGLHKTETAVSALSESITRALSNGDTIRFALSSLEQIGTPEAWNAIRQSAKKAVNTQASDAVKANIEAVVDEFKRNHPQSVQDGAAKIDAMNQHDTVFDERITMTAEDCSVESEKQHIYHHQASFRARVFNNDGKQVVLITQDLKSHPHLQMEKLHQALVKKTLEKFNLDPEKTDVFLHREGCVRGLEELFYGVKKEEEASGFFASLLGKKKYEFQMSDSVHKERAEGALGVMLT